MTTSQPKPLPFVYQLNAGAIAGITECLVMYPLDVVKTRMQIDPALRSSSMVHVFRSIVHQEGTSRLYRGIGPPLLLEPPKRAVKFASNDFWGKSYLSLFGLKQMNQPLSILTGATAGVTEAFVVAPFELIKIRLQDKSSTFKGPMDALRYVIRTDGIAGIFRGLEATLWRHAAWNGGYFGVIFQARGLLPKPVNKSEKILFDFISGTIGGTVGTIFNTPFDVVKTRIQSHVPGPGATQKYVWTLPSLVTVLREEGPRALYSGFAPKVLRLAPGGGVLLLVVDAVLSFTRQALGPPYI